MYKMTNIDTLGTEYSVADRSGKLIKTIQVIPHTEILEAALGEYMEDLDIQSYLTGSVGVLAGFEDIDPNRVMWYSTSNEEVVLAEIIEYAIKNGYDKIILEHLDSLPDEF